MTGMVPFGELPLSLPEAMVEKPSPFNNIWREAEVLREENEKLRLQKIILEANQEALINMVQELAETALHIDSGYYARAIERIQGGSLAHKVHEHAEVRHQDASESPTEKGSVGTDSA